MRMTAEYVAAALFAFADELAEAFGGRDDGYAVLNIGEYDRISLLCDEIANVIWNAAKRKEENGCTI